MSFRELSARCRGRWPSIIAELAGHPEMLRAIERGSRRPGFCPVHGGVHGDAFRVFADFEETGGAVCNTCGAFAHGFALLTWLNGWNFAEAARAIEELVGGRTALRAQPIRTATGSPTPLAAESRNGPSLDRLRELWEAAHPLDAEAAAPVRRYLASRSLQGFAPLPATLRCHPSLAYYARDSRTPAAYFPAMLAALVDPNGRLVALHRTYLTQDGHKAPVDPVKKLLLAATARASGGAVRLWEPGSTLAVSEGIENALAVRVATGLPVWAATSASLLASVVPPSFVRRVLIWADLDPPQRQPNGDEREAGHDAARRLAVRLRADDFEVEILLPRRARDFRKVDWNDVLSRDGPRAFPSVTDRPRLLPTARRLAQWLQRQIARR